MTRERRKWNAQEDANLREAVQKESVEPHTFRWREVAKSVPGRTNKDCRKRWCNVLDTGINKGTWSESEDERLTEAVTRLGTKWTLVAQQVGTRGSDQCASHWLQVLNPDIDFSDWKKEEDLAILHGYNEFGRNWVKITNTYLPRRTTLMVKNRYTSFKSSKRASESASQPDSGCSTSNGSPLHVLGQGCSNSSHDSHTEEDKDEEDEEDHYDDSDKEGDCPDGIVTSTIESQSPDPMLLDPSLHPNIYDHDTSLMPFQGLPDGQDYLSSQVRSRQYPNTSFTTQAANLVSHPADWMQSFDSPTQPRSALQPVSMPGPISSIGSQSTLMHALQKNAGAGNEYGLDVLDIQDKQLLNMDSSTWDSGSSDIFPNSYASSSQGSFPQASATATDEQVAHLAVDIKCLASKVDPILSTIFRLSESVTLEKKYISDRR